MSCTYEHINFYNEFVPYEAAIGYDINLLYEAIRAYDQAQAYDAIYAYDDFALIYDGCAPRVTATIIHFPLAATIRRQARRRPREDDEAMLMVGAM
jgi:hypothetical protein